MTTASRDLEVSLARRWGIVAGMDEVGRGALAGPVAVGVALIGVDATPVPEGLTDSKALTARRREALVDLVPGGVLLDGSHDWLSAPDDLFGAIDGPDDPFGVDLPVHMQVKADASCAVVAAASVLAKVERDHLMQDLEDPGYGWASNKGYGSAAHTRAIVELGVSEHHRRSWKMPTQATK